MRLVAIRPGSVMSCDLGTGQWRLLGSTAVVGGKPALVLVLRPMAAVPFTISPVTGQAVGFAEFHQLVVAASVSSLAEAEGDLKPIADAMLANGTMAADVQRVSEAMTLFRNRGRIKEDVLAADIKDAVALVTGYWELVGWLVGETRQRRTFTVCDANLVLEP